MSRKVLLENVFEKTPCSPNFCLSRFKAGIKKIRKCHVFSRDRVHFCMSPTLQEKGSSTHLVVASSGNAALATATVAKELAVRCTVFLSEGAGEAVFNFLQEQGVETTVSGKYYVDEIMK